MAKLMVKVKESMRFPELKCYAWSDSTIVLAWLSGHPNRWTTFVANRVAEIQECTEATIWKHIAGVENSADCATRGVAPDQLKNHPLWWSGPQWLKSSMEDWPNLTTAPTTNLEMKTMKSSTIITVRQETMEILHRFSSYDRLLRVTSYCHRFCNNCRPTCNKIKYNWLTSLELKTSKIFWIRCAQMFEFSREIHAIKNGTENVKDSRIVKLKPFLDTDLKLVDDFDIHQCPTTKSIQ